MKKKMKKMDAIEFVSFFEMLKEEVSRNVKSSYTNNFEIVVYNIDNKNKNIIATVRTETGYEEVVINITPQPQPELKYFSLKCLVTGEIQKTGDTVYLFLLKDGVVLEDMFGVYNGQGSVGDVDKSENYKWYNRDFITELILDEDMTSGIACISANKFKGKLPTISSDHIVENENIKNTMKSGVVPFHNVYHGIN